MTGIDLQNGFRHWREAIREHFSCLTSPDPWYFSGVGEEKPTSASAGAGAQLEVGRVETTADSGPAAAAKTPRILTCGHEESQRANRSDAEFAFERLWVHLLVYSAQEGRAIEWVPVPGDTEAGDIFLVGLASFTVPQGAVRQIGEAWASKESPGVFDRRFGVLGHALQCAVQYMDSDQVLASGGAAGLARLPKHPQFMRGVKRMGGGYVGLGMAHSSAMRNEGGDDYAADVSIVPFPDLLDHHTVQTIGVDYPDFERPMSEVWSGAGNDQLTDEQWVALRDLLNSEFEDPTLMTAIDQLLMRSAELDAGEEPQFALKGPRARWDFVVGE